MKFAPFKGKSRRTAVFTLISVFSIVLLLVGNAFLTYFMPKKSIYFDMTEEELYTLSDAMKRETEFIDSLAGDDKVRITFCSDPDRLTASTTTRVTYFMALKLQQRYENLEVVTVNSQLNPTALSPYKANSLTEIEPSDVIVSYGDRYRISSATKFWGFDEGEYFSYNGEYHMVTMIRSVTAIEKPKAYFLTGHGETYYDPQNPTSEMSLSMKSFADLLELRGLEIKLLNLSQLEDKKIPEDCSLLIINNPTKDFASDSEHYDEFYYVSETDILDEYLLKKQGAIMVAKDHRVNLTVLEDFLHGWGIEFGDYIVKDDKASLNGSDTDLIAEYNKNENDYTYAIYGEFAAASSSPRTVFTDAGYVKCSYKETFSVAEGGVPNVSRNYASFLASSKNATPYNIVGESYEKAGETGAYDLAALVIRDEVDEVENTNSMSYLFCTNPKDFFSNSLLGNDYYANFDILSALVENVSRIDVHASTDLGGNTANSASYLGKHLRYPTLSTELQEIYSSDLRVDELIEVNQGITKGAITLIAIIAFIAPIVALVFGAVIFIKRKFL